MNRRPRTLLLLPLLAACGEAPDDAVPREPVATADPAAVPDWRQFGFETWRTDFPYAVRLSPLVSGNWYGSTSGQTLERVVAKLEGSCSHDAWKDAHRYFQRAPQTAIAPLIEALDAALLRSERADMVENVVEALGAMGRHRDDGVARALMRAFEHPKDGIRNKVVRALVNAGNADTVRQMQAVFGAIERRAQSAWVEAVCRYLPYEEIEPILRDLLTKTMYIYLRPSTIKLVLQLPVDTAARLLGPLWAEAPTELRLPIAGVLHRVGDPRGTHFLRELLRSEAANARVDGLTLLAQAASDDAAFVDEALRLSDDGDWGVREAAVGVLRSVPGENIDNALTVLGMDEQTEVRRAALAALRERGVRPLLDGLIERVRTGSGTKLRAAVADLMAAGDAGALPAVVDRLRQTPFTEIRLFLQALANSGLAAAFDPLVEVFTGEERPLPEVAGGAETTVSYIATLLPNLVVAHDRLPELFQRLDRADHRRRAAALWAIASSTLVGGEGFRRRAFEILRAVVADGGELPQMRLFALDLLRPDLSLDDVSRLTSMLATEEPPMRRALNSFLFEFF